MPKGPVGQDSPRVLGRPAGMNAQDLRQALREDGLLRHLAALDAPREPVMEQLSLFDPPAGA